MKKLKASLSVILCTIIVFSVFIPFAGAAENFSKGDVDGNGQISASDARLALRASVKLETLSLKAMKAADVNEDDYVTAADARTILRVSVGLEFFAEPERMPVTVDEICDFYKQGVEDIKAGKAGYTKKEWQTLYNINVGGALINEIISSVVAPCLTSEYQAIEQINYRGSDEAKNRIAAWTLTDLSKVASATCTTVGDYYKITIIMEDEDTPTKRDSFLGQVTNSVFFWEDIVDALKNDETLSEAVTEFEDVHFVHDDYKIEAVMTTDGKFVSVDHAVGVDVIVGYARIHGLSITNKVILVWNYCKYYNFTY